MMTSKATATYGDYSPNDFPLYGVRDASRYLKIATATLRSWFVGTNRGAFPRVLNPAAVNPLKLSFNNLAEAYVLHSLRTEHSVQLRQVRRAISEAESELGIERLLLRSDLKAHAGQLLVEKYGKYLALNASRQYAIKETFEAVLKRFVWEEPDFPSVLFPYLPRIATDRVVALNPRRSFGAPHLVSRGITTAIIVSRFNAGETIQSLAQDYKVKQAEISAAIVYEQAA